MRILVVEDEAKVASFIARSLGEAGYAVDVSHQGHEALDQALASDYDLILLDVMLPEIDGWEILAPIPGRRRKFTGYDADGQGRGRRQSFGAWIPERTIISPSPLP